MTLEPIQYLLGALSGSLVGFTLGLVGGGGHGGSFSKGRSVGELTRA